MKSLCQYHGNYSANLTLNFFLIHISMNQIAKVDWNAFLSASESGNLSLLCQFGEDSTLVPQIAKDCDQFA